MHCVIESLHHCQTVSPEMKGFFWRDERRTWPLHYRNTYWNAKLPSYLFTIMTFVVKLPFANDKRRIYIRYISYNATILRLTGGARSACNHQHTYNNNYPPRIHTPYLSNIDPTHYTPIPLDPHIPYTQPTPTPNMYPSHTDTPHIHPHRPTHILYRSHKTLPHTRHPTKLDTPLHIDTPAPLPHRHRHPTSTPHPLKTLTNQLTTLSTNQANKQTSTT